MNELCFSNQSGAFRDGTHSMGHVIVALILFIWIKKNMKTHSIKGCEITPPKNTSGDYETEPNMFKMHQVCVAVGKRASGKTTAIVNLLEKMKYDRILIVSPTIKSNKELLDRLKIDESDIFEDCDDPNVVDKIKTIVEDEAKDLERYEEELRRYNKLMKALNSDHMPIDEEDLIAFFNDRDFMRPTHRWNGAKVRMAVVFDDCLGSGLYSKPRKLNALSTYSRHIGQLEKGGSIGISLYFLIQSFKCQTGGLNKVIRNQCTSMLLFKTKDSAELMDVAESVAGEIHKDLFAKVYEQAIGDGKKHEFLTIDLHPKKHHPSMFRKLFGEFIIPE